MKFSFLSLHLFEINILFVFLLIRYSAQQDSQDWAKVNDVVYKGPKYVSEGQTFTIVCRMSRFNAPKWTKNDFELSENNRISYENNIGIELTRVESLTLTNASAIDSGIYRCSSFSRAYHRIDVITSQPITSIPETSTHSEIAFEEIKEEFSTVVLNCNDLSVSDNNNGDKDQDIQWFRDGKQLVMDGRDGRRTTQKSSLIIKEATSADAGYYSCLVINMSPKGGSKFGQMIQLRAPIRVKPFNSPQSVALRRKYRIQCDYTGYPLGKIKWIIGNTEYDEKNNPLNLKITTNNDLYPDSVLIIENITESHNNIYTCVVDNGYTKDEASILLTVRESVIYTNSPILLLENKALTLICNYTDSDNNQVVHHWDWSRNGESYQDFTPEDKERIKIDPKDYSLVIRKADKTDIADWKCVSQSQPDIRAELKVLSKPWLLPFEEFQKTNYKSANIVEGQRFHLKCQVMEGYDKESKVTWFKFNESEENDDNRILVPLYDGADDGRIRINDQNVTQQTLTIEKVSPSDRFYYICIADNQYFTFNNTILLRVKDKLGALWPFLGIVAEVVILCTIIFIYEKRRIKPDFDDNENDNTTEPKGAQDRSKPQDVRQRK